MSRSFDHSHIAIFALVATVGCDPVAAPPPHENAVVHSSLIDEGSRAHHFGAVISSPSRRLNHKYRLSNTGAYDTKILELINRKPCCGEIHVATTIMHPGDETDVEVTLSLAQEFGEIVHETVVVTDPAQPAELILRTMAKAYPPIRTQKVESEDAPVHLTSDQPKRIEFSVIANGTPSEPAVDLERLVVHSTIKTAWIGPKKQDSSDEGLIIASRRLTAWLNLDGSPGERTAEVQFSDRGRVVHRHVLRWETVASITASPAVLVIQPGKNSYRVLLRSNDQKVFRVVRVECDIQGVLARAAGSAAALQQFIEFDGAEVLLSGAEGRVIVVFTDHPSQKKVELPLVLIK